MELVARGRSPGATDVERGGAGGGLKRRDHRDSHRRARCGTSIALPRPLNGRATMTSMTAIGRSAAALALVLSLGACRSGSEIGEALGQVLGGGGGTQNQVSGTVQGVDTRNGVLVLANESGQQAQIRFDQQTQVIYENQRYAVTNLERGDAVTARLRQLEDGSYYTDLVQVDRSVSSSSSAGSENVRSFQGRVGEVDRTNGRFTLTSGSSAVLVTLPYNVSRADQNTFLNLRSGDAVRFHGVVVSSSRIELKQFY
jgi:hypothetical protein